MTRVLNFSAGPSAMPEWVLKKCAEQMLEYGNSGQSVMEMSHRSKDFTKIINDCEKNLRSLMNIPDNYKVLFLQGGGSTQFAMIPLNLLGKNNKAVAINTGAWSKKAIKEIKKFGDVHVIADSEPDNFTYIPKVTKDMIDKDADYVYICENNTIYGTKYHELPDTGDIPLVADISSCICSEPIDISKYGLVFAGAQKNMGPAGLTIVIVREDLIGHAKENCPTMLDYATHADADSLYNTPPTFAIYVCGLVVEWLLNEIGGLENMKAINDKKANLLYGYLDSSKMFKGTAAKEDRSLMNVPFVTGNDELDAKFIKEAVAAGFVNVKGHRSVGGMRASIYNAMSVEGVEKLVNFMKEFENNN
ncbi:MAG: 3-phosphoserine/phosphohydroxythreonine transaminase [Erysipelotrichaceae bacterium]